MQRYRINVREDYDGAPAGRLLLGTVAACPDAAGEWVRFDDIPVDTVVWRDKLVLAKERDEARAERDAARQGAAHQAANASEAHARADRAGAELRTARAELAALRGALDVLARDAQERLGRDLRMGTPQRQPDPTPPPAPPDAGWCYDVAAAPHYPDSLLVAFLGLGLRMAQRTGNKRTGFVWIHAGTYSPDVGGHLIPGIPYAWKRILAPPRQH